MSTHGTRAEIGELRQDPSGREPEKPTHTAPQEKTKWTRTRLTDSMEPMDLLLGRTGPLRRVGGGKGRSSRKGGNSRVISGTLMPLLPGPRIDAHGSLSAAGRGASRPVLVGEGSCRQVGGESGLKRLKGSWRDRVRHKKWHRTCHLRPIKVFGALRTSCEDGNLDFAQPPKGLASVGPHERGCLDSAADVASVRGGDGARFLGEPDPW